MSTTIQLGSLEDQADYLARHVPGLTIDQAKLLLAEAFKRGSSVVFGGSRIRGDWTEASDLEVGFGTLTPTQAKRIVRRVSQAGPLQLERIPIVPGFQSASIPVIVSPEEFFQRSGIRGPNDPKAGQPFTASGSITALPDGTMEVTPAGASP